MAATTDIPRVKLDKGQSLTLTLTAVDRWTGQYGENTTLIGLDATGATVSTVVKADKADQQVQRNFKKPRAEDIVGMGVLIAKTPEGYTNLTPAKPMGAAPAAPSGFNAGPLIPGMDDMPYSDGAPSPTHPAGPLATTHTEKVEALYAVYRECVATAYAALAEATGREDVSDAAVQAGAATLLIARKDRGLL